MTNSQQPDTPNDPAQAELADQIESATATEAHINPNPTTPKPAPTPSRPTPKIVAPAVTKPLTPATISHTSNIDDAAQFAEVSDQGHVTLLDGDERVEVGQVPEASDQDALAYFVRKYDDVFTQLLLLEQRLTTDTATAELTKTLDQINHLIEERHMVGDMAALRGKASELELTLDSRAAAEKLAKEQAAKDQLEKREKIVAEAEAIAEQDPEKVRWKNASQKMKDLFDQWRTVQKAGPRLAKDVEDELWARFRNARTKFDKARRAFFSQLDERNAEAKKVKEKLIAKAEELSDSTNWGQTTAKFRDLMDEWKKAPRASRREDDALWARFNGAREKFYSARKAVNEEIDREFEENLKIKEAILVEADKNLPFKNVETARDLMRDYRSRWEDAGMVPRKDKSRMDAGFRKLEQALQNAEDEHWSRTNPETQARTNSALTQLEDAIKGLEEDLKKAQEAGNEKEIAKAQEALDARRAWLDVVKASAGS